MTLEHCLDQSHNYQEKLIEPKINNRLKRKENLGKTRFSLALKRTKTCLRESSYIWLCNARYHCFLPNNNSKQDTLQPSYIIVQGSLFEIYNKIPKEKNHVGNL